MHTSGHTGGLDERGREGGSVVSRVQVMRVDHVLMHRCLPASGASCSLDDICVQKPCRLASGAFPQAQSVIHHTSPVPAAFSRPRAGRIEEETRLARSVELVAQRRKIEGHLRAQSKAVKVGGWVIGAAEVTGVTKHPARLMLCKVPETCCCS
jgi:hypothetical protein